jgi:SAM-dependent methyltransferase
MLIQDILVATRNTNKGSIMAKNLTDKEFWESYWGNLILPSKVDNKHTFDRCLSKELEILTQDQSGEIFEIGCAPGKWIGFLAQKNGLTPCGIEYTKGGLESTFKNFELLQITPGVIFSEDFFKIEPFRKFDVVMSLGFIEHFENIDEVVNLHLSWLKDGGMLILGVPNFTGINRFIQRELDESLLDKHNLTIMNLEFFKNLGERLEIKLNSKKYLGSFEPDLFIPIKRFGNPIQILIKIFLIIVRKLRKFEIFDHINGSSFSSYILVSYIK